MARQQKGDEKNSVNMRGKYIIYNETITRIDKSNEKKKFIRRKFISRLNGGFSFLLKIKMLISISIEYYQPPQFFQYF